MIEDFLDGLFTAKCNDCGEEYQYPDNADLNFIQCPNQECKSKKFTLVEDSINTRMRLPEIAITREKK